MKTLTHDEIKNIQLGILDDVHNFCKKSNIKYSLAGGTLLGAIRHKGYIPWDDDIDILMIRPEYDRFIREYKPKNKFLKLATEKNDKFHVSSFAKIFDKRTNTDSLNFVDNRMVFIDIFPIDGRPDETGIDSFLSKLEKKIFNLRRSGKYYLFYPSLKDKILGFIKYLIKFCLYGSRQKQFKKLNELLKTYPFETSDFVGLTGGAYGKKEWFPKSIFNSYILTEFEKRQYFIISEPEKYLEIVYGNWWELPPVEERIPHHFNNVTFEDLD